MGGHADLQITGSEKSAAHIYSMATVLGGLATPPFTLVADFLGTCSLCFANFRVVSVNFDGGVDLSRWAKSYT